MLKFIVSQDAIFGVLEVNHDKAMHAINSEKCNINFLNKVSGHSVSQ